MTQTFDIKIDSMAFKGYGVARTDGKVVFIPYSVIGDQLRVEIVEEKKNYSIGKLREILKPSPWRLDPRCPYFGECGGCQWQHITYPKHGELKKGILQEILKRLGGLKETPSIAVIPCPDPYDYRTRVQLKVKGEALGYYKERSHHLVDIDHCPVAHPLVNQMVPSLRKALPSFSPLEEIEINVSPEEEKGVLIVHPSQLHHGIEESLRDLLQIHPALKGIAIWRRKGLTLFGDLSLNFTISLGLPIEHGLLKLQASSESFFQVNLKQNERLIQKILEFSEVKKNENVLDLYAGTGNLTLPLAVLSKESWGVEENQTAVKDARFNAERNGIKNCEFIHGKVGDILKRWKRQRPDLIVLDPPRTGCKMVSDQVAQLKPEKIVYVSCEPTTFARDLHFFAKEGYALQRLALIDMFPQTYHMEVVGLLQQS